MGRSWSPGRPSRSFDDRTEAYDLRWRAPRLGVGSRWLGPLRDMGDPMKRRDVQEFLAETLDEVERLDPEVREKLMELAARDSGDRADAIRALFVGTAS